MNINRLVGVLVIGVAVLSLSGCYTTSISNTGNNHLYRGELSGYDVLGIDAGASPAGAWKDGGAVRPAPGIRILLVQSGAMIPDAALEAAFAKCYTVVPFGGGGDGRNGGSGKARSLNRELRTPVSKRVSNTLQRGAVRTAQVEEAKEVGYEALAGKVAGR